MRKIYLIAALVIAARTDLCAQKTGTLLGKVDPARWNGILPNDATEAMKAKHDTTFAVLLFDPSVSAPARSSAWTATIDPSGPNKEAKIQANLCDIFGAFCPGKSAAGLTLAGPLNTNDDFTELADLGGLVGSARVEGSWTNNSTSPGAFYSLAGAFSDPSFAYRDSTALAKRSVDHAGYSLEADIGTRTASAAWHLGLRADRSYHARTSENICTPASFGPSGTTTCASLIVGAPTSVEHVVVSAGAAWSFGGNGAARVTISHDMQHGVTGVDVPVWVIPDAKSGPAGGVRFGYRTDDKHITVSLFVSAFKL
ncbi:MAG TPA: hypothetical protein VGQ30_12905 [Gemmatimonadaceae bacterium]|nr:hypothetical protein [Gemmatimonadaceae bacterium]